MRKLVVVEFLSLDGVMQAPGDPNEDTEGGFTHGGWQRPYFDDVMGAEAGKGMAEADAYLFGRRTYEIMAAFWPNAPADDPFGGHLNAMRKHVASRTLRQEDLAWENSTLLDGDVTGAVAEIKAQPGKNITVLGSGDLVQTLIANDLVDEYSITLTPIVLGSGKRLFKEADQVHRLRLVESKPTPSGCLILTYRPEAS
jgi:dihydrofolate reductase